MPKINPANVSKTRLKAADRRGIKLSRYNRKMVRDSVNVLEAYVDEIPAQELISKLQSLEKKYGPLIVGIEDEYVLAGSHIYYDDPGQYVLYASYDRLETDEEAAARVIKEYDEKNKGKRRKSR